MITISAIHKQIVIMVRNALKGTEYESIKIMSSDTSEGFDRPSIKVNIESSDLAKINANYVQRIATVSVYFFATDIKNYKIENLKIQDFLENIFIQGVRFEGCYIPINEIEVETIDSVLETSFMLDVTNQLDKLDELNAEYMEDLNINYEGGC
ncbi:hypothetical protein EXM65_12500 [Clostridium botulinum]|uniref:Phage protein n=1 Tax=Clostridium botulinum TaxID=1491 RepID=A0A6M0SQT2_CLOBO|nr:hypothetical protein [Clostridium botulinum]MBY6860803.1 hypothetical protein [Clostridium botulinum]MBY7043808.1 hypothetical protein [Clostridium botulinum]NFA43368.1 hypothetical protein [Clostridium botulinum]NFO35143.1 hypothetical protein [Clostridium botulinum]NFO48379.1 hypothetical protein [Clostridium botulinum]